RKALLNFERIWSLSAPERCVDSCFAKCAGQCCNTARTWMVNAKRAGRLSFAESNASAVAHWLPSLPSCGTKLKFHAPFNPGLPAKAAHHLARAIFDNGLLVVKSSCGHLELRPPGTG